MKFHERGIQCSQRVVSVTNPSVNPNQRLNQRRPDSCQIQLRLFFHLDSFPQRPSPTLLHSSVFFCKPTQCFQLILNQPSALRQQFVNQGATPPHSCHGLSAETQSCRRPLALLSATMSDHLGRSQHASPRRAL